MPLYTVRAPDGKILTINAADTNALQQAMHDYSSGVAQMPAMPRAQGNENPNPTPSAEGISQTPVSPDQPLNNRGLNMLADVVKSATPVGPISDLAANFGNYSRHPGRTALDVAALASYGIPFVGEEAGPALRALGGAAAGTGAATAGLDMTGIQNPLIRAGVQMAGGLGGGAATGALTNANPLPGTDEAAALMARGGKPSLAQMLPEGTAQRLASTLESSARANPWTASKFAAMDQANANAVADQARASFGGDILDPASGANTGNALKDALTQMIQQRTDAYAPQVASLQNAPGFPNYGRSLLSSLSDGIENGDRQVTDSARDAFLQSAQEALKGKTTPAAVDKALTDIGIRYAMKFPPMTGAPANQLQGDFGYMMGLLKDAHYGALNRLSSTIGNDGEVIPGTLGDELREAKGDYANASQGMSPLVEAINSKSGAPEAIGPAVLRQGSQAVGDLTANASNPDAVRQLLARSVLESAKSGANSDISASRLASALNANRNSIPALGQSGQDLGLVQRMAKTAGQQDLGVVNPSKTAALGESWRKLLNLPAVPIDVAYAHGVPLVNAARGALSSAPAAVPQLATGTQMALRALGILH